MPERALYRWLGAGLFVALNGVVLRTAHHWGDVPWRLSSLLASKPLQAALTLTWTLTALAAMVRRRRGAGCARSGCWARRCSPSSWRSCSWSISARCRDLPRVVAFLGVGVLLLVIGFVSPLPPAAAEADARRDDAARRRRIERALSASAVLDSIRPAPLAF